MGITIPSFQQQQRSRRLANQKKKVAVTKATKPTTKRSAGRPQKQCDRPYMCTVKGCGLSYPSSAGLYQHRRAKHPELIVPRGSHSCSSAFPLGGGSERRFECPNCDKSYETSAGLYQHKSIKHPELIRARK